MKTRSQWTTLIIATSFLLATFHYHAIGKEKAMPPTIPNETRKTISLDGTWAFALDPHNVGEKEHWSGPDKVLAGTIQVPGCWQAQGFGDPQGTIRHNYVGAAWYKKRVLIPADWKDKSSG